MRGEAMRSGRRPPVASPGSGTGGWSGRHVRKRPQRKSDDATLALVVTPQRCAEAESIIETVRLWAAERDDVRGVAVVGSWARDAARMDSDIDIVVLTDTPGFTEAELWTRLLSGEVIRLQQWGPLREVRVQRPSGIEVEVGIAPVSWASTTPVDAGTYRVIHDGHRIVHDPIGILAALSSACQ